MSVTFAERLVDRLARRVAKNDPRPNAVAQIEVREDEEPGGSSRRGFLGGAALVGAALATDPWGFIVRPVSAYASICGSAASCADGYTVFCCTINSGRNSCPPDSFIGGWWKADNSSFCGGSARYYIDCNAYRDGHYTCRCNQTTCDQRRVACNQFRYGQCNTQIPYSNTGPVLCRIVSCTPPWQQYAGVCSSSSATDNKTATHSAPCVGQNPVGHVDSVRCVGTTVYLTGWAYDPDAPGASINVALYQEDGHGFGWFPTAGRRADVNAAYGLTGNHGFTIAVTTTSGPHTFRLYGINVGGGTGNPLLATRPLVVNPGTNPLGHVDSVLVRANTVRLRGWAADRDAPSAAITVAVLRDGVEVGRFGTPVARPDVNRVLGVSGSHGFDITLTATSGLHRFSVRAVNVRGGTGDTLLYDAVVNVNPGAVPVGALDSVISDGATVRLRGWAYDPDRPGAPINIAVLEDGDVLTTRATAAARADVNARYRITGAHGFDISLDTTSAVHTFTVAAINVGGGASNRVLGARTLAVNVTAPIGVLDAATRIGGAVRLAGWAFDPDKKAESIRVALFVDGAGAGTFPTAGSRPDVNRIYGVSGAHGFDFTAALTPGPHTITVYAVDSGGVRPNPLIGTRTVT